MKGAGQISLQSERTTSFTKRYVTKRIPMTSSRTMKPKVPAAHKMIREVSNSPVSEIVRSLRNRASLTLTELAERSGVSASTISKIETGQLSPGYESIQKLAFGLNVDVGQLFRSADGSVVTGRRGITRAGQGTPHSTECYAYEALAADISQKKFLPLLATVKARSVTDFEAFPAHDGEEFVYVLSGRVRLHSEYYEPLELEAGDSVYFDSRSGHALLSTSKAEAKILWICSDRDVIGGGGPEEAKNKVLQKTPRAA